MSKLTQDGVSVTPATKAVAGQFTYTPYAGVQWGGDQSSVGGVYLFYYAWNQLEFDASTSQQFLTLPFRADPNMQIQQGWKYTWDGDTATHRAIDYVKGTINRSATWQSFDVLAAADGKACKDSNFEDGWGNYIRIGHRVGGVIYESYYGHLASVEPTITLTCAHRSTQDILEEGTPVSRGAKIGVAGTSGTEAGIHLHFQLTKDGLPGGSKVDSYDLYTTTVAYPDPNGANDNRAGTNHYWTTNPPTYWDPDVKVDALLVTQPSHLLLRPGESSSIHFDIQNTGNATWTSEQGFLLENINGETLGALAAQSLQNEVPPGQVTRWEIPITAPQEVGRYSTDWQMTYNGEPFGPVMSCLVIVRPEGDTLPGGDTDIAPLELLKEWFNNLIEEFLTRLETFLESIRRELERQLQRELERLWREFWEDLFRQCCGANLIAPASLLLGAWGINRRRRERTKSDDRG